MDLIEKYLSEGFKMEVRGGKVPIGNYAIEYVITGKGQYGNVSPQWIINSAEARKKFGKIKVIKKTKNSVVISADARLHDSLWQSFGSLNEPITVKDYHG